LGLAACCCGHGDERPGLGEATVQLGSLFSAARRLGSAISPDLPGTNAYLLSAYFLQCQAGHNELMIYNTLFNNSLTWDDGARP
jgi:hypothetical protein